MTPDDVMQAEIVVRIRSTRQNAEFYFEHTSFEFPLSESVAEWRERWQELGKATLHKVGQSVQDMRNQLGDEEEHFGVPE